MFCLRIGLLLCLVSGTLSQGGFDLADAFDNDVPPTPAKPKEQPKAPEKPKNDGGLDLSDAFGPDEPPTKKPQKPSSGDSGSFGFDLEDAVHPDPKPKPDKPDVIPPKNGGGGGTFGDSDLLDVGGGDYKPDGGRSGGGGASDSGYDPHGGADQPQDPDLAWGQILKMLNSKMPEEFYMWMANLKQVLKPLLERAMELLQALPV